MEFKLGSWTVHFMNSRDRLTPYIPRIKEALDEVAGRATRVVPSVVLDIEVEAARLGGIPETGHSGYVPRPGLMRLMLDPENENLPNHLGESLERMIAHELHHVLRWDTVGYGENLLAALASEGLCGRFAYELYGNAPEIWECALTDQQIESFSAIAVDQANESKYDHNDWFFGGSTYPRWTGYTLGYLMVKKYSEQTGKVASDLVATEPEKFAGALETLKKN